MVRPGMSSLEVVLELHAKLARVVMWLVFVTAHLALLVLCLFVLWWMQTTPASIQKAASGFLHSTLGTNTAAILGFLGVSGTAALLAYAKAWQWLLRKALSVFLWSE